jgi:hypothetical protein
VSERSEFHFQEKTFPTTAINPPKPKGYYLITDSRFGDGQACPSPNEFPA